MKRFGLLAIAVAGLCAMAGSAQASHHQVKISEVLASTPANLDAEFVEVQMLADNENLFLTNTASLDFYNAAGTVSGSVDYSANATNGNQRTVLATTVDAATDFSVAGPDLVYGNADLLSDAGGAVCFHSGALAIDIDCVSYGTFNNTTAALPVGTAAPPLSAGQSLNRSISPGCATQLEAGDDTNNSATDFTLSSSPTPTPSAVAPSGAACPSPGPGTGGGGGGNPTTGNTTQPSPQTSVAKKCPKGKKLKKGKCMKKKRKK